MLPPSSKSSIPASWLCPITQEIMTDPVIGTDGHTYERSAIVEWLKHNSVSPMTRQHMAPHKDLIPNIALRQTIEAWKETGESAEPLKSYTGGEGPHVTRSEPITLAITAIPFDANSPALGACISDEKNSTLVNVSIVPPNEGTRRPARVICILDTSYSMGSPATMGPENNEGGGFSRLDLVKHSVSTVIGVLEPQDQLALISFSSLAEIVMELTNMDSMGKKIARNCLNSLAPDGMTNIWDGLRVALNMHENAKRRQDQNQTNDMNTILLLLTDGEPNTNPPRGIVATLDNRLKKSPMDFTLHSFGFGYELDSKLLTEIATLGKGIFSFIPDASMVGTVFVNFISTMLAIVSNTARLSIRTPASDGIGTIQRVINYDHQNGTSQTQDINIGIVQYGQTRNVAILLQHTAENDGALLEATLHFDDKDERETVTLDTSMISKSHNDDKVAQDARFQFARLLFVEKLTKALQIGLENDLERSRQIIAEAYEIINSLPKSDKLDALLRDIRSSTSEQEGQVEKAFSRGEWFIKWGRHYLPSLIRSHLLQQCNNFKDPGVQGYGGSLFRSLQAAADDIFCNIPPPKPQSASRQHYQPVTNMRAYYNSSGVCFHGENLVEMGNGSLKKVEDICAGDVVRSAGDAPASVLCVIKFPAEQRELVQMEGGLKITPWHPVCIDGKWEFPSNVPSASHVTQTGHVFNFVLENGNIMFVQDIQCVTLGHGFQGDVVGHEFFGTHLVIENLKAMEGWEDGLIVFHDLDVKRNPETDLVVGWTTSK